MSDRTARAAELEAKRRQIEAIRRQRLERRKGGEEEGGVGVGTGVAESVSVGASAASATAGEVASPAPRAGLFSPETPGVAARLGVDSMVEELLGSPIPGSPGLVVGSRTQVAAQAAAQAATQAATQAAAEDRRRRLARLAVAFGVQSVTRNPDPPKLVLDRGTQIEVDDEELFPATETRDEGSAASSTSSSSSSSSTSTATTVGSLVVSEPKEPLSEEAFAALARTPPFQTSFHFLARAMERCLETAGAYNFLVDFRGPRVAESGVAGGDDEEDEEAEGGDDEVGEGGGGGGGGGGGSLEAKEAERGRVGGIHGDAETRRERVRTGKRRVLPRFAVADPMVPRGSADAQARASRSSSSSSSGGGLFSVSATAGRLVSALDWSPHFRELVLSAYACPDGSGERVLGAGAGGGRGGRGGPSLAPVATTASSLLSFAYTPDWSPEDVSKPWGWTGRAASSLSAASAFGATSAFAGLGLGDASGDADADADALRGIDQWDADFSALGAIPPASSSSTSSSATSSWRRGLGVSSLTSSSLTSSSLTSSSSSSLSAIPESLASPTGVSAVGVALWNVEARGHPEFLLRAEEGVYSSVFHPLQAHLVLGGLFSGTVLLWDLRSERGVAVQRTQLSEYAHSMPVNALVPVVSSSGHELLSSSNDGRVCTWDLRKLATPSHTVLLSVDMPKLSERTMDLPITSIALVPGESRRVFAASSDGAVCVADTVCDARTSLPGGSGGGGGGGGGGGASEGADAAARVGKSQSSGKVRVAKRVVCHTGPITSLALHPRAAERDAPRVLTASADWTVGVCRPTDGLGSAVQVGCSLRDVVYDARWSPTSESLFAAGDGTGRVSFWRTDRVAREPVASVSLAGGVGAAPTAASRLLWAPDGRHLLVGDSSGRLVGFEVALEAADA